MFWRFGGYANISAIDQLLEKQDVTVEELLDESDLIQELKSQNSKLVEFLRDELVLDRLLQYVILPKLPDPNLPSTPPEAAEIAKPEQPSSSSPSVQPATEDDPLPPITNPLNSLFGKRRSNRPVQEEEDSKEEKQRLKYAYVACEVLSSDVWSISEALLDNLEGLHRFWYYLKRPSPLDGVQASYFAKVNESLLEKKTEEMLAFFKSVENVVGDMIRHVDCPVISDLLLKIISLERAEGATGIIDVSSRLVKTLLMH
jgi:SIT4-associating protein SAP185/190